MTNLFLGRDAFLNYAVSVTGMALIIPVLFWLFFGTRSCFIPTKTVSHDSDSTTNEIVFWLSIAALVVLVAPGTSLAIQKLIGLQSYEGTMIAIPIPLLTIYAFIDLSRHYHLKGRNRIAATICLFIIIVVSSSIFITYDHPLGIRLVSNSMKIDSETQELCKEIGDTYALLPEEIYGQIGEFDSGVENAAINKVAQDDLYSLNTAATAERMEIPLFVIKKSYEKPDHIAYYHYKKTAETEHYVIYQRSEE